MLDETRHIMSWLARELSPDTYGNVMGQYDPAGAVSTEKYPEINRKLLREELEEAIGLARAAELGLTASVELVRTLLEQVKTESGRTKASVDDAHFGAMAAALLAPSAA